MGVNDQNEAELTEETQNDQPQAADVAQDELSKAQALVAEFKDALQRERADFQNYRRRIEKERESLRPTITAEVITKFLPIIDDLERAMGSIPQEDRERDWVVGILQISRKFNNLLEAEGIKIINPIGEPFDPNFHEAIGADEPTDAIQSGHITAVLQKGYVKGDRVLRPAMVRVAS